MAKNNIKENDIQKRESTIKNKTCGVIMPIAEHPDYKPGHWSDVLAILNEALDESEFEINLVSDDVAIGLIHERIVNNIYSNEIVICDVSSKNPNVMFELGMRLAFDKPTIIIKDEKTGYSFDTGVIEHLSYPSDLRFGDIKIFKENLKSKVIATYEKSKDDNYSPFLKSFGKTILPTSISPSEISAYNFILEQINNLRMDFRLMRREKTGYYPFSKLHVQNENVPKIINTQLESYIYKFIKKEYPSINLNSIVETAEKNISLNELKKYLSSNGIEIPEIEIVRAVQNIIPIGILE